MSLSAFLKENVVDANEVIEFVVSDRFKDEEGNPIPWQLSPMTPSESLKSTDVATVVKGKQADFKTDLYLMNIVTSTVKFPNLKSQELQDSYGVFTAEALIDKMLNASEFNKLLRKCQKVNGLDTDFEDLKDEVKN